MKHTIQSITAHIKSIKNKYKNEGFEIVGIFGSYSRGTANKYSDVDIAYTIDYETFNQKFKGGFSKLLRIEEIQKELQKLLHLKVDLISLNGNNETFQTNIKEDMLYV